MSATLNTAPNGVQQDLKDITYPSQFLGEAANFMTRGVGRLICAGSDLAVNQISLAGYGEKIGEFRTKYKVYEERIFQVLFAVGLIYQARSALISFVFGFIWGGLSGLNIPIFKISFLDRMPDNIWNKESGYLAQKIQGILFALNFIDIFKNPVLDNCIFGGIGGFVAGVTANKQLKEYSKANFKLLSSWVEAFIKGSVEKVNLQDYINLEVPKEEDEAAPNKAQVEQEQLAPQEGQSAVLSQPSAPSEDVSSGVEGEQPSK